MGHITVLFYLNGNNELEPEVWNSFFKLYCLEIPENITVVAQVARQSPVITEIMRSGYKYPFFAEQWSGIRRYEMTNKGNTQLLSPEISNMSSPQTLYDFIVWAQSNYPADKYILLLGGHAYQFVGISPDFTCDKPYLMGFPELSYAMWKAYEHSHKQIDMLVLDTCYASSFETLYELESYPLPAAKYLMTYIGNGPLGGLPYDLFVKIIKDCTANTDIDIGEITKSIINKLPTENFTSPMLGICLNKKIIEFCKKEFDMIAGYYLENQDQYKNLKTPYEVITADSSYPWHPYIQNIHFVAESLIIAKTAKPFYDKAILPIHILYKKIPDKERKQLYRRLSFCKNNSWCRLVCGLEDDKENIYEKVNMQPLCISKNILQSFVSNMNLHIPLQAQLQMTDRLIQMRKWKLEDDNNVFFRRKMRIAFILPHCHLTGGMKMLLQQMSLLKRCGHIIYAVFRTDEPVNDISLDWSHVDADKEIIIPYGEKYEHHLPECDVIAAGWFDQLPELTQLGIPVLYSEQGHECLFGDIPAEYSPDVINQIMQTCYKTPCHIFSVSRFVSNVMKSRFGLETKILTNCIDTELFHPGEKKEDNVILLVGNPRLPFKGFSVAIAALNIVWRLGYKLRVKWACQEEPDTTEVLFPLEIIKRPPQDKLAELYRSAEIYVFTSWYEGFGMPPLEAMASGTAVICTSCGGISEYIIGGYNAITVPLGDVEELAANIILLLKNTDLRKRLEINAVESAKKFDCNMKVNELEQAFNYVMYKK